MIKSLLFSFALFSLATFTNGGEFANRENDDELLVLSVCNTAVLNGNYVSDFFYRAEDPTKKSSGAMIIHLNFPSEDIGISVLTSRLFSNGTQMLSGSIHLPDCDNISFTVPLDIIALEMFPRKCLTFKPSGNNNTIVKNYKLDNRYSNPFNPLTKIKNCISNKSEIVINAYDIMSNKYVCLKEKQSSYTYTLTLTGSNNTRNNYDDWTTAGCFNR